MRATRSGWTVTFREGDGPDQAFWVDIRNGTTQSVRPQPVAQRMARESLEVAVTA
jgi:hypothetical protein